ncbi:hypothetical protein K2P56_01625 [Patescibacteria group bacterium]|nr:hypothetical protein [Patescibacteria group bacterium]
MERKRISARGILAFVVTGLAVAAGGVAGTRAVAEREALAQARFEQRVTDSCAWMRNEQDRATCEEYVRADTAPRLARAD